jgi:hypothetical protein
MLHEDTAESLRAVIAMLEAVPPEQFNMHHWWLEDGMAFDEDRNLMYKVADGPCGCVVGHLIQRGLLDGAVIEPRDLPAGSLPYQYHDRVWVQIADALKIYNDKIAEWLFSQYSYSFSVRKITKEHVISRIRFMLSEMQSEA